MQTFSSNNRAIRVGESVHRRGFLQRTLLTGAGSVSLNWSEPLSLQAKELQREGMACILLFMRGAPSQFETFDPKPGTKAGGPTKAIETAVQGIRIAEGWNSVAERMKDLAIIRSVTNKKEGNHDRAVYQLHTGYLQSGTISHPSLGAVTAAELGDPNFDLPHFVNIGNRTGTVGPGFLGNAFSPFVIRDPLITPNNIMLPDDVDADRFVRRQDLLNGLESDFADAGGKGPVRNHQALYRNAKRMVLSPRLNAFDLAHESDSVRDRFGRTDFGQGCLLARRLVEAGVTFVEVESSGWDTHADNFNTVSKLAGDVGTAFGTLLADLKDRGMLKKTLVIWMGEFGRTPRINEKAGRDHHPLSFNVALAGGGIQGGQVIGKTNTEGSDVAERPVTIPDLFCTLYRALRIDPRKEIVSPLGRPIQLADGGKTIDELF